MEVIVISALSFLVTLLLTMLGFMIKRRMDDQDGRMEKHEEWIRDQQKDLHLLAKNTDKAIELIKQNQDFDRRRLELFEQVVLKMIS